MWRSTALGRPRICRGRAPAAGIGGLRPSNPIQHHLRLEHRTVTTTPHPDTTSPAAEAAGPHQLAGDRIEVWTEDKVRALGVVTDLPTAARILGLGRALAYQLAAASDFPVPVLRVGNRYRVPVAAILTALHIPTEPTTPATPVASVVVGDLTTSRQSSVDHHDAIRSSGPQHDGAAPT